MRILRTSSDRKARLKRLPRNYSGTNIQVEGVDEGDIVKQTAGISM